MILGVGGVNGAQDRGELAPMLAEIGRRREGLPQDLLVGDGSR